MGLYSVSFQGVELTYQHDGCKGGDDGGGDVAVGLAVADDDGVRGVEDYQHLEDGS